MTHYRVYQLDAGTFHWATDANGYCAMLHRYVRLPGYNAVWDLCTAFKKSVVNKLERETYIHQNYPIERVPKRLDVVQAV